MMAERDACQVCKGKRGGEPGNENLVNGVVMCDYCHSQWLDESNDPGAVAYRKGVADWKYKRRKAGLPIKVKPIE